MSDRLTLVVFKDHLSSRTLTLRLKWLRGLGLTYLSVIFLSLLSAALFLNAYRKTHLKSGMVDARKVDELEKELKETQAAYEAVKKQALSGASAPGSALLGAANSFHLIPQESLLEALPDPETLPFRLEPLRATFKSGTLQIKTAIEYFKEDGGNQQGHFFILTRGQQSLHAYPDGVFEASGSAILVKPESGEYFSVSRYREIKADFGSFTSSQLPKSIELYIFDTKKRLIFKKVFPMEGMLNISAPKKKELHPQPSTHESAAESQPQAPVPPPMETPKVTTDEN